MKNRKIMKKKTRWEVYIIQTTAGKLYTGITTDLDRRFEDHQSTKRGAKFFSFSSPESVVYRETLANRSEASRRESAIKKLTRQQKLDLIEDCNND